MSNLSGKAKALREIVDVDELERMYDNMGDDYEEFLDGLQYNGPLETARAISNLEQNRKAKILDVGCGTGFVGQELSKDGYEEIHGVDMSAGLLKVLEKKGVYSKLIRARFDPNSPLQYADGFFDVIASCGCFIPGAHLNQSCLPEIFRLLKPGGYMVITTRKDVFEDEIGGIKLKTALINLVQEGVVEKVSHEVKRYSTEESKEKPGIVLSYRLLN